MVQTENHDGVGRNGTGTAVSTATSVAQDEQLNGILEIRTLPVERIRENDYNPNEMSKQDLEDYAAEIVRLGHLPRPLVVRPVGDDYVLVDGEHGLKAARSAGLRTVPCEVVEVDDFEARRQSYQRNRHGAMNPVVLGQMFRQMQESRGISNRVLAKTIGTSEGTVRNALTYAKAFDVRKDYAPEDARKKIARLSVGQVRKFVNLPENLANRWLDEGADLKSKLLNEVPNQTSAENVRDARSSSDEEAVGAEASSADRVESSPGEPTQENTPEANPELRSKLLGEVLDRMTTARDLVASCLKDLQTDIFNGGLDSEERNRLAGTISSIRDHASHLSNLLKVR